MWSEKSRIGSIKQEWVPLEKISKYMPRSAVAAEDANFCSHGGFDIAAIKQAMNDRSTGGASSITQQVTKNVFLWQGRSWIRKGLETIFTPFIELLWGKKRIIEIYLNIAEFDEGVFGVGAASAHYFGKEASKLTELESARLAAILPNPKNRSAIRPSKKTKRRTHAIIQGARTIHADGRDRCFSEG